MFMIKYSVVICAYNATARLRRTLEHLVALDYQPEMVEIILVDNNSNDGTAEFAQNVWAAFETRFSLRIVMEKNQGLSHARKRGIREAQGEFIVFCDDDNWLDSQYLKIANAVLENNSAIGVIGGQGIPVTDAEQLPNWFYTYADGYATGVQAMNSGDISARGYVWGAGAIVRRYLLLAAVSDGKEWLMSDRTGSVLSSGGDSEMCKWYLLAGYKLWYEERMMFHHFIPKDRLTLEYLEKQHRGFEQAATIINLYDAYLRRSVLRKQWYNQLKSWLLSELRFFLNRNPDKKRVVNLARSITQSNVRKSY